MPTRGRRDGVFEQKSLTKPSLVRSSTWPAVRLVPYTSTEPTGAENGSVTDNFLNPELLTGSCAASLAGSLCGRASVTRGASDAAFTERQLLERACARARCCAR